VARVRLARVTANSAEAVALTVLLFLASAGTVEKYLGTAAVFLFPIALFPFALASAKAISLSPSLLSERQAVLLAGATLIATVVLFLFVYPIADEPTLERMGTDRDDAANLGARRLLDLEYPYHALTYAGNGISQLPGSLFLAAPFVVLGNSAYQNFFWFSASFVLGARLLGSAAAALAAAWVVFLGSPTLVRELVTGGDIAANALFVLIFALGVLLPPRTRLSVKLGASFLLGLAFSSRANFLLILPLIFGALVQKDGLSTAIKCITTASLTFVAVTAPFYLYDRSSFAPAEESDKLAQLDDVVPYARPTILVAAILLSIVLALRRSDLRGIVFLENCAVVQGALVATVGVVYWIGFGDLYPLAGGYGLMALFFGLSAVSMRIVGGERDSRGRARRLTRRRGPAAGRARQAVVE
jgi:hypothetical protein